MQIKQPHATIILLSILFISLAIKKKDVYIPNNQVSMIEYYQNPKYRYKKFPEKNWRDNPNIEIDTISNYKDIISNVESNFGRNWIRRYRSGVRFEFYPPR